VRKRTAIIAGAVTLLAAAGGLGLVGTVRYGFSAQDEPAAIEMLLARTMRHYAVPADLRKRKNPVPLTPEVLAEARAHFADHCASCHGNDGRGQTSMGRRMYPKAPDMSLPETQSSSDGELFATIENGIRLTGMPGWGDGTAESAYGSWTLVHFIRHAPRITPEEIAEMEKLNPKSPEEIAAAKEEEEFLAGADDGAPSTEVPPSEGGHHHH
jgi:mono/diheme cytochrome c family protein